MWTGKAEKMVWAFERAFEVARVDEQLLEHLLVAAACLVAQTQHVTPRGVCEPSAAQQAV
jgi:hypothetical protein